MFNRSPPTPIQEGKCRLVAVQGRIMADEPPRSITESIRAWMRAVVLPLVAAGWTVIGAFWTYYTWYYKEVLIPSTAPVNITTQLSVKQAGLKGAGGSESGELEAIEGYGN